MENQKVKKRVFIDCGAYIGNALKKFFSTASGKWVSHAFEPNPYLETDYPEGVIVHSQAVWIEDGRVSLYFNSKGKGRKHTTIMKNKTSGYLDKKHPLDVECIDFSKWLLRLFSDEYIVLKMDIEGAEYKVLRKMLDDGSIRLINKMYVEFHVNKMKLSKGVHLALVKDLLAVDGLELHGDFIPSAKRPKSGNIKWYLGKQYGKR